jgi:hypothetical protein
MEYRNLTDADIAVLSSQGCFSENWQEVKVTDGFEPEFCRNAVFSGNVKIGKNGAKVKNQNIPKFSGIYNAHIHNCKIGDNVYIANIGTHIANYEIGDDTIIENTDTIEVRATTSFANGVRISVLNEQGGRNIPMFVGLSAQFAYMAVFYRHNKKLIEKMENLAENIKKSFESDIGKIGAKVKILNAGTISDCNIGDAVQVLNTARLHCGTIISSSSASVHIGTGVIADHFIINESSSLLDRAIISHCFVGEGCDLSREFSAEHSLFFANFIGHHGEAFAVFAGPHTATHHKSSLLISGYFLFNNTGRGSSQSNHLYKRGAVHQGIFDRGTKTASNSYILYPARIGPFTLILGRHTNHCDTKDMPYSYLIEQSNKSVLIPGTNLRKIGTVRDADKWKVRDNRKGVSLDLINYDLLNPYSVSKMLLGKDILYQMKVRNANEFINGFDDAVYKFNGTIIPKAALSKGIRYYKLGIVKFLGNVFVRKLLGSEVNSADDFRNFLRSKKSNDNEWLDIAGCILPQKAVNEFIEKIENETINSVEKFNAEFAETNGKYYNYSWEWCIFAIEKYYEKPLACFNKDDLVNFIDEWIAAIKDLDDNFLEDAKKEYADTVRIGFGIDGNKEIADKDFLEVRGEFDKNEFVKKINVHLERKLELYKQATEIIKKFS